VEADRADDLAKPLSGAGRMDQALEPEGPRSGGLRRLIGSARLPRQPALNHADDV
jgi:hypothetical protein